MTRRILTDGERRLLFGVPEEPDVLTRHYSLSQADLETLADRRGDANRLGFAVQLALLRHPGIALAAMEQPVGMLTAWLAERLEIPVAAFAEYASRPQTMTDHARLLATTLGLRPAGAAVVAERLGQPRETALTLGRAVAGSAARVKARSIRREETQADRDRDMPRIRQEPVTAPVVLLGKEIRLLPTEDGELRAADSDKPRIRLP